jgi:hypothetical protein
MTIGGIQGNDVVWGLASLLTLRGMGEFLTKY